MVQTTLDFDKPPAQRHSATSVAAAEQIEPHVGNLQAKVLSAIRFATNGLTDEQGIAITQLSPSTYRPRRIELQRAGLIYDSGETRLTLSGRKAVVWRAK